MARQQSACLAGVPSLTSHVILNNKAPPQQTVMWTCMSTTSAFRSLKQEGQEFKAGLGYMLRPCLKGKQIKHHKIGYSGLGLRERTRWWVGDKGWGFQRQPVALEKVSSRSGRRGWWIHTELSLRCRGMPQCEPQLLHSCFVVALGNHFIFGGLQ